MRALWLGLILTLCTGCVGAWGPDVPRPVVIAPAPIYYYPYPYYYPYYYHPHRHHHHGHHGR